jgi:predicted RNA binding protein YcfA (HicA-like mRNA interferase family)
MSDFGDEVRRALLAAGCIKVREGKGSHTIWRSPINARHFPVPARIKSRHTANEIVKQAGLAKRF